MRQDAVIDAGLLAQSTTRMAWWVWPLAALAVLLGAGASQAQVSVSLKSVANVTFGDTPAPHDAAPSLRGVTLTDIADIDPSGSPESARIGEIIVAKVSSNDRFITITIAQVHDAMDAARVSWAKTTLRGASCRVTVSDDSPTPVVRPSAPRAPVAPTSEPQPIDTGGPAVLRTAIAGRLLDLYNVPVDDLRLAFEAADEDFLAQPIGDRRVDVQPCAGSNSARTPVNVFIYDGDRLTQTRMVSTRAVINRTVVTARSAIARNEAISEGNVEIGRQWLAPNSKPSATPEQAIGQIASRAIAAGTVVTTADITSPIVCKRGDIVWVHVLSGGMSVKAKARALGEARDGERVQLKLDGPDELDARGQRVPPRIFMARMSGPGKAVMIADDAPAAPLDETKVADSDAWKAQSDAPARIVPPAPSARPVRKAH